MLAKPYQLNSISTETNVFQWKPKVFITFENKYPYSN